MKLDSTEASSNETYPCIFVTDHYPAYWHFSRSRRQIHDFGETVRNETIHVDVEISVPQADAIHVLSARYMPKGYEAANVKDGENIVNNQAGWFSCAWPNDAFWREAKKKGLQEVYAEPAPIRTV